MNLVKESLAKLLAQEDLIVEHRKVDTAQFNVETRVLTLPMWHHDNNLVVDMLIAHEVGHALFTPNRWDFIKDVPLSFVNVTEDIRIEKLMKRRYEGLPKTFFGGYNVLAEEDFFQVDSLDMYKINIADKLNLHYKIGNFVDVPFTSDEAVFRDDALTLETFDDALELAKRMHAFAKEQIQKAKQDQKEEVEAQAINLPSQPNQSNDTSEDNSSEEINAEAGQGNDTKETEGDTPEASDIETDGGKSAGRGDGASGHQYTADDVQTADACDDAIRELAQRMSQGGEYSYVELPKSLSSNIFVNNQEVSTHIDKFYIDAELALGNTDLDEYETRFAQYRVQEIRESDREFNQFKKQSSKEISYLVKEFECKKSATAYARATTSRTGVLNTSKLHTYKFNEDLFKKVTCIPEGKNHGLIFILDWSGSMSGVMLDTIKQLYNLLWFCKKVQIPFEVYAFTADYPSDNLLLEDNDRYAYTPKDGLASIDPRFSLMNLFSSKVRMKEMEKQMINIWRIASSLGWNRTKYSTPIGMTLSGTPLNEALISLHQLIPHFKSNNKVEKVQCVVLTDGESNQLTYHRTVTRSWDENPFFGHNSIPCNSYLRDRKTGRTYFNKGNYYHHTTTILLRNLRDRFSETNFVGIRILAPRDANYFLRTYFEYDQEMVNQYMSMWRKQKAFSIKDIGYNSYFGLSSSALNNDVEFEVDTDATKSQIKNAFKKSLNGKKMNKKILGEFVELIA